MKIATAAYVLDKGMDLKMLCTASKGALEMVHATVKHANPLAYPAYILEHDGVMLGMKDGKRYSLEALLYGILLMSGNDASNVIAENVSGSIESFVQGLNEYLQEKGIIHTRFQNPHGLHHPAQMTTAYDMARIGKLAFDHPEFVRITRAPGFEGEGLLFENRNPLLKQGKYRYDKVIGGKTGYIKDAGYNLVACAEHEGRRLIVVLLGCASSQERCEDAIALFETAFREKATTRVLFSKDLGPFINKEKGWTAHLNQEIVVSYYPSEETTYTTEVNWYPKPRKKQVGQLIVKNEAGVVVATEWLYLDKRVRRSHSRGPFLGAALVGAGLFLGFQRFKKGRKQFK